MIFYRSAVGFLALGLVLWAACSSGNDDDDNDDDSPPQENIRRLTFSLDGDWDFQPSDSETPPTEFSHSVPVPGLVDLARPEIDIGAHTYYYYRTTFDADALTGDDPWEVAYVKLWASQYDTHVWLNGEFIDSYLGAYTSHRYFLTDALVEGENELVIRVGRYEDLDPLASAVGRDLEKESMIPGIWDKTELVFTGKSMIRSIQTIPDLNKGVLGIRVFVESPDGASENGFLTYTLIDDEGVGHGVYSGEIRSRNEDLVYETEIPLSAIAGLEKWSLATPHLYRIELNYLVVPLSRIGKTQQASSPSQLGTVSDTASTTFGFRTFEIRDGDFYLNGEKFLIRGSNIAFHRWLSDPARGGLAWDEDFIQRALIDVAKEHNLNFFRFHVGHAASKWFDIADRGGMLLQDEWFFWGFSTVPVTGMSEVVLPEFRQWLEDNWNHPSLVMWDMVNEGSVVDEEFFNTEIGPKLREWDPTRVIEPMDFKEWHTYQYGQEAVLNEGPIGLPPGFIVSPPFDELMDSDVPVVTNEFPWLWFNDRGEASGFTEGSSLPRLMGPDWESIGKEERWTFQAWLTQEMIELYRRLGLDGIQPFVYIGDNEGATFHYFQNPLEDLNPKPVLGAIANAFEPFGVSIDLWDRHYFAGKSLAVEVYLFNDDPSQSRSGDLVLELISETDGETVWSETESVAVDAVSTAVETTEIALPERPGDYLLRATLTDGANGRTAVSEKPVLIYATVEKGEDLPLALFDPRGFTGAYLTGLGYAPVEIDGSDPLDPSLKLAVASEGSIVDPGWEPLQAPLDEWVRGGGNLVLIEPTYLQDEEEIVLLPGLELLFEPPQPFNALSGGGYDSILWWSNVEQDSALTDGVRDKDLWFFNGGYGNVISPDLTITSDPPASKVLAVTGPALGRDSIFEVAWGAGKVIVFGPQLRGRLLEEENPEEPYALKVDPVAQRLLINLIEEYAR